MTRSQTALSQEHNLYFIAYGPDIYVYQPEFPEQTIRNPVLILPSQPSSPDLRGYLDADEPHAINYLIVNKLGKDEVIATVRDDGDVEAFLVRHVVHAIATRVTSSENEQLVADNVKPLFQRNVGISAWGLAIHTQARIIAVSSNRHEVTVFRFGLVNEPETSRSSQRRQNVTMNEDVSPENQHLTDDNADLRPQREADVIRQVLNGQANIPHIGFCNTGDDPDGRWLLTTDISGVCRAIDLHNFALVQAFRFGPSFGPMEGGGYDRMNAGWGIMFLDPKSFIPLENFQDALGMEEDELLPDARSDLRIWDISKTMRHQPDMSSAFSEPRSLAQQAAPGSRSTTEASSAASSPPRQHSPTPSRVTASLESMLEEAAGDDSEDDDDDDDESGVLLRPSAVSSPQNHPSHSTRDEEPEPESEQDVEMWSDLEDSDDENTEYFVPPAAFYDGKRICGNVASFVRPTDLCEDLPCPVLHASIRNVYLLQPSQRSVSENQPFLPPMIGMAAPLKQSIQAAYKGLNMFDRLNMHAYIPTLGVVVLASQKGRAIVLSLAKVPQSMKYPTEIDPSLGLKANYTLRAECVLPFESQEKAGQRPFAPLHGIAVGPVQGTEAAQNEGKKRWRLMMMFQDHSVLSYEIQRTKDRNVGVEDLVV